MRASILLWSTASGLILGVFIDATLVGVALLLSTVLPSLADGLRSRWVATAALFALCAVPIVLGVLGYLEGQLKTV